MAQRRQQPSQKSRARSPQQTVESLRRSLSRERHQRRQAIEQQQATAEILKVISESPTDIRPVFQAIAERAARLCEAGDATVFVVNGEKLEFVAHSGKVGAAAPSQSIERGWVTGRAVMERAPVQVEDVLAVPVEFPTAQITSKPQGVRTVLALPLMVKDVAVGAITLRRREVRPFSDKQIALLKTFTDQAVIAIENVRLFNETKDALERQTATSEILRVISSTPTDVQPVFDAIVQATRRLIGVKRAALLLRQESTFAMVAHSSMGPQWSEEQKQAVPLDREKNYPSRAILAGEVVHIADWEAEDVPEFEKYIAKTRGIKSGVIVPLMRQGEGIGALAIARETAGPYHEKEIALLRSFADQAVIAIENARLFNETKEALAQQKATTEVLGAISSSIADTNPVFDKIANACQQLFASTLVGINLVGEDGLVHLASYHGPGREQFQKLFPIPVDRESGTGLAILERQVQTSADVQTDPNVPETTRRGCKALGVRSGMFAPILWEGTGIGAIFVARPVVGAFSEKEIALFKTFADQAAIAIQNARLFREIQEKSAQLEVASKHKSEFLANMSHELRTPLNAIIGFSEVMMEQMFGELNEKQLDYQKDINESGKHLLSLINDILDLSKIEAGRMELELSSFHLPTAVSNAVTLIRERAERHGIALGVDIDEQLGDFQADERKVKQILLNLLSNAVKFTPDGGRVDVSGKLDTDKVKISVRDTGVGITPEDQASLFEEFKQLGKDSSRKAEGTGLGLALTKRLVELHGGQITVESAVGQGSIFCVALPLRH